MAPPPGTTLTRTAPTWTASTHYAFSWTAPKTTRQPTPTHPGGTRAGRTSWDAKDVFLSVVHGRVFFRVEIFFSRWGPSLDMHVLSVQKASRAEEIHWTEKARLHILDCRPFDGGLLEVTFSVWLHRVPLSSVFATDVGMLLDSAQLRDSQFLVLTLAQSAPKSHSTFSREGRRTFHFGCTVTFCRGAAKARMGATLVAQDFKRWQIMNCGVGEIVCFFLIFSAVAAPDCSNPWHR